VQKAVRHTVVGQSPVATMTQRPAMVVPAAWPKEEQLSLGRRGPEAV